MICTAERALPMMITSHTSDEAGDNSPLFIQGDSLHVLRFLPDSSIDFCMTSPPF